MSITFGEVTSDPITYTGSALYATLDVGSDIGSPGDTTGLPSYTIGDTAGDENWAYYNWDSNLDDGFDTGNAGVMFRGAAGGAESLAVGSGPFLSASTATFGSVGSVDIVATVYITSEVKWSNVTVRFYRAGSLQEIDSVGAGPDVNTTNTPSTPEAQQVLTVTPAVSGCDRVIVTGSLRMTAPAGTNPTASDMSANILVFAAG
jgi:hypothetical protein